MAGAAALALLLLAAETPPPPGQAPLVFKAPAAPDGCRETLKTNGLLIAPWALRPAPLQPGVVCEAPEGVYVRRGATGLRFQPAARVGCAFGLRLAKFETIVQEEAKAILGSRVRAVVQLGTYNCRRMARFPDLVSEHSFANAIDVEKFLLANGRAVVVERDWVRADSRDQRTTLPPPPTSSAPSPAASLAARFLRRLTRRLYDEQVFSVVLTPSYDSHHRNHLHLDGAPYTVDGT